MRFPQYRSVVLLAVIALTGAWGGCSGDPAGIDRSAPPLQFVVQEAPALLPNANDSAVEADLRILIFDVTADPFIRNTSLDAATSVIDDTLFIDDPESDFALAQETYALPVGTEPRDFRVFIQRLAESGADGARTARGIVRGENRTLSVYLTPSETPSQYGIQVLETWARPGEVDHVIPIVLANPNAVGGFQFDLTFPPGLVTALNRIVVDESSRLFLEADSSSIVNLGENPLGENERWRVIVFSDDAINTIEPGHDVVLYLEADIGSPTFEDSLQLTGVVIADPSGFSIASEDVVVQNSIVHLVSP